MFCTKTNVCTQQTRLSYSLSRGIQGVTVHPHFRAAFFVIFFVVASIRTRLRTGARGRGRHHAGAHGRGHHHDTTAIEIQAETGLEATATPTVTVDTTRSTDRTIVGAVQVVAARLATATTTHPVHHTAAKHCACIACIV